MRTCAMNWTPKNLRLDRTQMPNDEIGDISVTDRQFVVLVRGIADAKIDVAIAAADHENVAECEIRCFVRRRRRRRCGFGSCLVLVKHFRRRLTWDSDEEFNGIAVTVKRELGIVHAAVGNVARRGRLIVDANDGSRLGRCCTGGCGRSCRG